MLRCVGIGANREPDVVGLVGAAGEDLAAVDDVLVSVAYRPRSQRGEVGARLRLRIADRAVQLAPEDGGQEARPLVVGSEPHDRRPDRVHGDERERRTRPLHLVEEDELVGGRPALSAVLLRPAHAEPAVGPHLRNEGAEQRAPLSGDAERGAHLIGQQLVEIRAQLLAQRLLLGRVGEVHPSAESSSGLERVPILVGNTIMWSLPPLCRQRRSRQR